MPDDVKRQSQTSARHGDERGTQPHGSDLTALDANPNDVVFVSVATGADSPLPAAHELASRLEDDIREAQPHMTDVVVHTEP